MSIESKCNIPQQPDYTGVKIVELSPEPALADYLQAMSLANQEAEKLIGDNMLLAWYDKDRDFESPQHASECHLNSAIPGYIDYALYHGAKLKIDIENGRFVFFYLAIDF
ncbi:MAG: AF1514 family protein [Gammaproteobacteria bacterium]|nr:AF1514 family protein [Gammaproteobacteria bacterium]